MHNIVSLLNIIACCLIGVSQVMTPAPQPVTAYKTEDTGTPWTVGIYTSTDQLIPDQVVFKKDTNFTLKKGGKLHFNFDNDPNNYIYVYRLDAGDTALPKTLTRMQELNPLKSQEDMSKFGPITSTMAPAGSKIKLTKFGFEIDTGLMSVKVKVKKTDTDKDSRTKKWVIQSLKEKTTAPIPDAIYDTISITKDTTIKKLKVPKNKTFWILVPYVKGSTMTNFEGVCSPIDGNSIQSNSIISIDEQGVATVGTQNQK